MEQKKIQVELVRQRRDVVVARFSVANGCGFWRWRVRAYERVRADERVLRVVRLVRVRRISVRVWLIVVVRVRLIVVVRVSGDGRPGRVVIRRRSHVRSGRSHVRSGGWSNVRRRDDRGRWSLRRDNRLRGTAARRFADHFRGESVDRVRLVLDRAHVTVRVQRTVITVHLVTVSRLVLVLLVAGRGLVYRVREIVVRRRRRLFFGRMSGTDESQTQRGGRGLQNDRHKYTWRRRARETGSDV